MFPRLFTLMRKHQKLTAVKKTESVPQIRIKDYEKHLVDWYGTTKTTIKRHRKHIEDFHSFIFEKAKPNWKKVEPAMVLDFVRQRVESNPKKSRYILSSLRCYFRYMQVRGHNMTKLLETLPCLYRSRRPLPERLLSQKQIKQWLAGFDQSNQDGLRDYAMALCFADLGIRIGDLVGLCLKDINWRNGTIRIPNSKTGRSFWLPLPARTGKAIAKYLRFGRPKHAQDKLFLRHKPPLNEPLTKVMVQRRMKHVAQKQDIPWFGVHALRHTAATRMRAGGASLKEIADVLGNVNLNSTAIYAKVDIQELSKIALPWPEVRP